MFSGCQSWRCWVLLNLATFLVEQQVQIIIIPLDQALHILKLHGMSKKCLQAVSLSTVVSRPTYASPTWRVFKHSCSGLCWWNLEEKLEGQILSIKLAYRCLLFTELCEACEDNLFKSIMENNTHLLHLPSKRPKLCNTRARTHPYQVPNSNIDSINRHRPTFTFASLIVWTFEYIVRICVTNQSINASKQGQCFSEIIETKVLELASSLQIFIMLRCRCHMDFKKQRLNPTNSWDAKIRPTQHCVQRFLIFVTYLTNNYSILDKIVFLTKYNK